MAAVQSSSSSAQPLSRKRKLSEPGPAGCERDQRVSHLRLLSVTRRLCSRLCKAATTTEQARVQAVMHDSDSGKEQPQALPATPRELAQAAGLLHKLNHGPLAQQTHLTPNQVWQSGGRQQPSQPAALTGHCLCPGHDHLRAVQ